MELSKFKDMYGEIDEGRENLWDHYIIKVVHISPWTSDDGKWESQSTIFSIRNIFTEEVIYYEVCENRSGSYYTDYYYEEPQIYQVKPKEIVQTIWEPV